MRLSELLEGCVVHAAPGPHVEAAMLGVAVGSGALRSEVLLVIALRSRGFICG